MAKRTTTTPRATGLPGLGSTRQRGVKSRDTALAMAAVALEEAAASPIARPAGFNARRSSNSGFSPYPDLHMAINMLRHRSNHVQGERKVLVEKWISQLTRLQAEMTRLHKLEKLADSMSKVSQAQPEDLQGDLPL